MATTNPVRGGAGLTGEQISAVSHSTIFDARPLPNGSAVAPLSGRLKSIVGDAVVTVSNGGLVANDASGAGIRGS
jgi:hypothetical protein